ncbi:MAG: LacI family transcriptional regulator [Defluviitaleaceae bacterium]|nr:LacI family transcriptional regulator [Defluviitaleaceae bacterium]MCL2836498.1 LacI family transcriptional regulator [Defluviitaleaceae bacterium]
MVTLKDIAREAGVSVMTVSRVVNDIPAKVSCAKRMEIKGIIERMGYVPNSSARSLSSRCSRLIAIILPYAENVLDSPYNAQMVGYICGFVQDMGYTTLLYNVRDYREVTVKLRTWNVDGAIFLGLFDSQMKSIKEDNRIPLVFTDSYSPLRQVTNVGIDDFKGGELAARHLLDKGHRNMSFVGEFSWESPVVRARFEGFKQTLLAAGTDLPERNVFTGIPARDTLKAICAGGKPVTAFFAVADITAIYLIQNLMACGFSIPRDCSVIGFDNLAVSGLIEPPLTTIEQDIEKKARTATEILFRHIADPARPAENVVLDVCLVERESVADRNI